MQKKETEYGISNHILLSFDGKILFLLLFLIFQNNFAKSIKNDSIDFEKGNIESQDSISLCDPNTTQAVIYITSGVSISNLDTETNYKIVKVSNLKKSIASKSSKIESKKKIVIKTEYERPKLAQTHSQSEETFTSSPESDIAISIQHINQIAVVQTQNQVLKYFVNIGFIYSQIIVLDQIEKYISTYLACFHSNIHSDFYAVRPPPFYV